MLAVVSSSPARAEQGKHPQGHGFQVPITLICFGKLAFVVLFCTSVGREKVTLEVARLCVQEDEKIAEAIKTFWHLSEAARERM